MRFLNKLSGEAIILLIGIAIFMIGCIQPFRYESAKENGYEVTATVVDVDYVDDYDMIEEKDITKRIVYVDYVVDGKEYKRIEAPSSADSDNCDVGDTIKFVVSPIFPQYPMFEGGVIATIGFCATAYGIYCIIKAKTQKRKAAANNMN